MSTSNHDADYILAKTRTNIIQAVAEAKSGDYNIVGYVDGGGG